VVGEGREVRLGTRRNWFFGFFSCGGSGRLSGGGGPRCQTGDEEELVGSSGGRSAPTGVGVATNCYEEHNKRRHKRR